MATEKKIRMDGKSTSPIIRKSWDLSTAEDPANVRVAVINEKEVILAANLPSSKPLGSSVTVAFRHIERRLEAAQLEAEELRKLFVKYVAAVAVAEGDVAFDAEHMSPPGMGKLQITAADQELFDKHITPEAHGFFRKDGGV